MYSKFRKLRPHFASLRLSTKITALYGALLFITLWISSILLTVGVYATFYHQAQVEIEISEKHIRERLLKGGLFGPKFWRDDPLLPGVVLRVTDQEGRLVLDTDSHYPSIERVRQAIREDPPFWASNKFFVADFHHLSLYYAPEEVNYRGRTYELHFFRTITSEQDFLAAFLKFLFAVNILGFVIALSAGFLLANRILSPIRDMTKTARRIEADRLDRRLNVPPAEDELSELARTLNHMLDRLEQGFAAQQRFVSDASHELRTPVTVLLGYSDMLARWGSKDPAILAESIESIRSEAENMQELIEKLLFLARADQKRQELHKEPLRLAEILADIMQKLARTAPEHHIELTANEPGLIYGDKVIMRQLFRIFLDNAVKYTPPGGSVCLSSRREGDFFQISVRDTGPGIDKDKQEKIFERFYRVDTARSKEEDRPGGTGLGLSIAKWIAAAHDIKITVESAPGEGSAFILTVPAMKEDELFENNGNGHHRSIGP